jgi:hypothetical protein
MDNKHSMTYEEARFAARALEQDMESKGWHVVVGDNKERREIYVQSSSYSPYGGSLQRSFPYI